jgi:predicted GIY-YIG superfamily endonuclease
MFYVYLLRSIHFPNQTYVGNTDNLQERLETHNAGGSQYTRDWRPWELVVALMFTDRKKAAAFEKYLKSGSGRAFAHKRFW